MGNKTYSGVNQKLTNYVETNILPKYDDGSGHGLDHIRYVIGRSLKFAEQVPDANKDICYTVAAYHDLGRLMDNDYHEKLSAAFVRVDENLQEFFTPEQIELIAEAVEDHRASSKHEPRSIYGKIVSSADRSTDADEIINRSVQTRLYKNPNANIEEVIEDSRQHAIKKYGESGYARSKMYFKDPSFDEFCKEISKLASDPELFKARVKS